MSHVHWQKGPCPAADCVRLPCGRVSSTGPSGPTPRRFAPRRQVRRVQALSPQQSTDLAGLRAPVSFLYDPLLEGGTPTQDESDDARAGRWYAQGNGWAVASIAKKAVGIAASEANRQTARAAARARSDAGGTGIACRDARIAAERQMRVAQRKHLLDALWSSRLRRRPGFIRRQFSSVDSWLFD